MLKDANSDCSLVGRDCAFLDFSTLQSGRNYRTGEELFSHQKNLKCTGCPKKSRVLL